MISTNDITQLQLIDKYDHKCIISTDDQLQGFQSEVVADGGPYFKAMYAGLSASRGLLVLGLVT